MSGGKFDYLQFRFSEIIDTIENAIVNNNVFSIDEDGGVVSPNNFKEETIGEFKKGIELLNKAYIYTQRIDWLLSGDDAEGSFYERLYEDLLKLNNNV
mgnify:CR=1 FL=1